MGRDLDRVAADALTSSHTRAAAHVANLSAANDHLAFSAARRVRLLPAVIAICLCVALISGYLSFSDLRERAGQIAAVAELRVANSAVVRAAGLAAQGQFRGLGELRGEAQRFQSVLERTGKHDSAARWRSALSTTDAMLGEVTRRFSDTKASLQAVADVESRLMPLGAGPEAIAAKDGELIESTERLIAQLEQIPFRFGERFIAARALSAMQRVTKAAARAISTGQSEAEAMLAASADQRIIDESLTRLELSLQARDEVTLRMLRQTQAIRDQYNAYLGATRGAFEGQRQLASVQTNIRAIQKDVDEIAQRLAGAHAELTEHTVGVVPAVIAAGTTLLAGFGAILLMRARRDQLESARVTTSNHDATMRVALNEMAAALGKQLPAPVPAIAGEPVAAVHELSDWVGGSIATLRARQDDLIACMGALTTTLQKSREDAISILEAHQNKRARDGQVDADAKQSVDRTAAVLTAARESVKVFENIAAALSRGTSAMHGASRTTSVLRERARSSEQRLRDLSEDLQVVASAMKHSLAAAEQLEVLSASATQHFPASEAGEAKVFLADIERLARRIIDHLRRYSALVDRVAPLAREAYDLVKPSITDADAALTSADEARAHFEQIDVISKELMKSVERICAESKEVASSTVAVWEGTEELAALNAAAGECALRIVESSARAVEAVLEHLPAEPTRVSKQAADAGTMASSSA